MSAPHSWSPETLASAPGKRVGGRRYLHIDSLTSDSLDALRALVAGATSDGEPPDFNVVRVNKRGDVGLLDYPDFWEAGFPALRQSWLLDSGARALSRRQYDPSVAPVLHRKELLLPRDHAEHGRFAALSARAEELGLLDDPEIIGTRHLWEEELVARDLTVVGNRLVPGRHDTGGAIKRHRTAIGRTRLSVPVQNLWRHGFLREGCSFFDYGCGRGDDIRLLLLQGRAARGWDPHHAPSQAIVEADVVNLGYVINVIEDASERTEVVRRAFTLARRVLSVAALIGGRMAYEKYRLLADGVVTGRETFQKYFSHAELGDYLQSALGREPVSVAPGVYFVFQDDEAEQEFLAARRSSRLRLATPRRVPRPRVPRPPRMSQRAARWAEHEEELTQVWEAMLELGRAPDPSECPGLGRVVGRVGSKRWILRELVARNEGEVLFEEAQQRRTDDLRVHFALSQFERRTSFGRLPARLQRDVRAFFGSMDSARDAGRSLLFAIAETDRVVTDCSSAGSEGFGVYSEEDCVLKLDARLASELPPLLRVFIGCADKLNGDSGAADIVELWPERNRVVATLCDDFALPIPSVIERQKVDLAKQVVRFRDYGLQASPPPVVFKSRLMHPAQEDYKAQAALDRRLEEIGTEGVMNLIHSRDDVDEFLEEEGLRLEGWELVVLHSA